MAVYLETDRVILRDWQEEDREEFARINRDPMVMEFYPERLDEKASDRLFSHFSESLSKNQYGFYALEHKERGVFMGFSGVSPVPKKMPFSPATELAWRLDYEFWGKGYGTEIAKALIDHAQSKLKLDELVAYCLTDNDRAAHLLDRLGFMQDMDGAFDYAVGKNDVEKSYLLYRMNLKKDK